MILPNGPELRDIHVPTVSAWWPLAPGWWVLIALLLLAIVLLALWLRGRRRQRRFVHAALGDLRAAEARYARDGEVAAFVAATSQLLRRIARARRPASVSRRGEAWRHVLGELAPGVDIDRLAALDDALYAPAVELDVDAVARDLRAWAAVALASTERAARGMGEVAHAPA
ncbi:uncharacterized protein DUF4381 [Luteibacter rhizovicinus]|uniref:Uncharacterized protein DUF4381 n=1 Tax=Luteibacter rhizovicinus TaxID=242606 RepID=A0A4R3YW13_9GAMM|nr:DUF4381 family protein [Luteibacter rhizovicinus]TCV96008.1 uncharacterized protein DUF4381 [Luteibacter rhizovicinus]